MTCAGPGATGFAFGVTVKNAAHGAIWGGTLIAAPQKIAQDKVLGKSPLILGSMFFFGRLFACIMVSAELLCIICSVSPFYLCSNTREVVILIILLSYNCAVLRDLLRILMDW